jgi:predicted small integral membrane protein
MLHHHMQTPIMTKTIKTPCFFSSMVILLAKMKTMKNAQTKNKRKYEKEIYI